MIYKEIPIQVEGSDKTSRAQFYILDTLPDEMKIQKRPIILICPGGGYHKVSYREGEPLAMHFLSLGYHACVLQYSVSPEAFYPTQLLEVTESVRQIHEHAKEWYIDTKKLYWRELQQEDIWRLITVHFGNASFWWRKVVCQERC